MRRFAPFVAVLFTLLVLVACGETPTPQPPTPLPPTVTSAVTPAPATDTPVAPQETPMPETPGPADVTDIVETVAATDDLSSLSQAIIDADLVDKLSSDGPYTLFAPTNAALEALPSDISDDPDLLFDLLLYHAVNELINADAAATMGTAISLLGDELQFSTESGSLLINGVPIVNADIEATNGVIHLIDTALIPPTLGTD